jgi:bifunctional oligoribonuclease and PAP phosphatase NrnA
LNSLDFSPIKDLFKTPRKILLTSHTNPDGDAIGAVLATYLFFKDLGHDVSVIVPNSFPDYLAWMSGSGDIKIYENEKAACDLLFADAEILFSLDYNHPNRLKDAEPAFNHSGAIKILIDHHVQPKTDAYHHVFSTTETSSTSELIFDFIIQLNPEALNRSIAECIYAGILTDTGSFSYSCNSEKTFRIVAALYSKGIDGVKISRMVYSTFSASRLRLLGYSLSEKLRVLPEYATAYISLTKDELDRFNYQVGDTEDVVNYALSIKGIRFAAMFMEREKKIRVSLRSVGDFSVNAFAREHFEGGGHKNAAGGDSYSSMEQTLAKFEQLLPSYKSELLKI